MIFACCIHADICPASQAYVRLLYWTPWKCSPSKYLGPFKYVLSIAVGATELHLNAKRK
jgi:hypothetical protein